MVFAWRVGCTGADRMKPLFDEEIGAGEFKARCLALMDRIAETGETLVITKRGHPVARLVPYDPQVRRKSLEGSVTDKRPPEPPNR